MVRVFLVAASLFCLAAAADLLFGLGWRFGARALLMAAALIPFAMAVRYAGNRIFRRVRPAGP